jgi:hypothetical protein
VVRSYTINLTSSQAATSPQVLDHGWFWDKNADYAYTDSVDGSLFINTTGTFIYPFTADDELFTPWGYAIQDVPTYINVGPLKGPYTVVFSPDNIDSSKYIIPKIVYDFGDGEMRVVSRETRPAATNGSAASGSEPNSVTVSHDYYPQRTDGPTVYQSTVTVYNSNLVQNIYNISISSVPLSIYDVDEIHLLNSVQQYNKNETQNIFELRQPNYLTVGKAISAVDPLFTSNKYPFNPNTSLTDFKYNLVLWLDASDGPTVQKDNNDNVLTWVDKSAYENNFTAGAIPPHYLTDRRASSNRRAVHFTNGATLEGSGNPAFDSIFYGPNSKLGGYGYTIFLVGQLNNVNGTIFSYDINNGSSLYPNLNISFDPTNTLTVEQGHVPLDTTSKYQPTVIDGISDNLSTYSLFSVTLSGDNNSISGGINGSGSTNATAIIVADTLLTRKRGQNYKFNINYNYDKSLSFPVIGASNAYPSRRLINTEISELLIFNTPLNDSARTSVLEYLINKWNLTLKTN